MEYRLVKCNVPYIKYYKYNTYIILADLKPFGLASFHKVSFAQS